MNASLCASPPRSGKPNGLPKHPLEPLVQDNDQTGAGGEEPFYFYLNTLSKKIFIILITHANLQLSIKKHTAVPLTYEKDALILGI